MKQLMAARAKILIIATNRFKQAVREGPRDKLRNAGAAVTVDSLDG